MSTTTQTIAEFLGTAFFLGAILLTSGLAGQFAMVGAALAAAVFLSGRIGGPGHLNPAVSLMMLARGSIDTATAGAFVAAQIAGGLTASAGVRAIAAMRA